ncbi:MAG: hypothetical protein RI930_870, partial [Pseudomonadota bacterium]
ISLTLINKKDTSQKSIIDKIGQLDKNTNTQPKIPSSK